MHRRNLLSLPAYLSFRASAASPAFLKTLSNSAAAPYHIPSNYQQVWSDEFTALSLRTGGPTYYGLAAGKGTWSAPGASYNQDPRGVAGFAYDWFVNPEYPHWPKSYSGPFAITDQGLRIRSEANPEMSRMVPQVKGTNPWMSGCISSFHAVRISPPFYFEARAKMPSAAGMPFPAIWLMSGAKRPWPDDGGKEYEIDVHEGYGDSDKLHMSIHWNPKEHSLDYPERRATDEPAEIDLSADFNTWGCHVTASRQVFVFNGRTVGWIEAPPQGQVDQPYGIVLDVSAGIPWKKDGLPSGGPHDMVVRYVRLFAPDARGLVLQ